GVSLKPISGAGEALTELAGQALLTFVTARPVKEPIEKWLSTILQGVPLQRINVIATGHHSAKGQVLRDLGIRYFVEDHLETCQELFDMGIGSIVFDQPWNRKYTPYLRVRSWTEIMALIR
ncbi:MAG TPA: haloacid dehalogenase, partial [Thermodesulfobacteriaceae bacterium]|nr:haloacid dehalogenase [Thermodesulfobacteriaceae bacterium]